MLYLVRYVIVLLLTTLGFSGCIIDEQLYTPSYIRIDTIALQTTPLTQGSNSAKISDAWIYVNQQPIGIFELPCQVPVLNEGEQEVTILAGVQMNGIAATRIAYPFYKGYVTNVNFKDDSIYTLQPVVNYFEGIDFKLIENFDNVSVQIIQGPNSQVDLTRVNGGPQAFEGGYGLLQLTDTTQDYGIIITPPLTLAKQGAVTYLEIDYKNTYPFAMGIFANSPTDVVKTNIFIFNRTENWNKTYINLTDFVSSAVNATSFNIYFELAKNDSINSAQVFLDNIKILQPQQ